MYFFTLIKIMLAELREKYVCASCNDFNLAEIFPDRDARHELMKKVLALADDPYNVYDPSADYKVVSDTLLLKWVRSRIDELESMLTNPPFSS